MAGIQKVSFTSPYSEEEADIARRRRMAELLQARGMEPAGETQMVGGWAIPKSPWEGVGKMAQSLSGAYQQQKATELAKALQQRQQGDRTADMTALAAAFRGREAIPAPADALGGGPGAPAQPGGQIDPAIIGQLKSPEMQSFAMQQYLAQMQPQKPMVVGRSLLDPRTGKVVGQDATWQSEQEAMRKGRETEAEARRAEAQRAEQARFDQQRQMAQMVAGMRQPAQQPQPQVIQTAQGPMVLGPGGQAQPITGPGGVPVKPAARGGGPMTATAQKELIETEEQIQGGQAAIGLFKQARAINDQAMGFTGAGALASAGSLIPEGIRPNAINATQNLDNILQTAALPQLKAIFGGMPTEGERKILLDVQGSSSKPASVRKDIFKRAEEAINARIKFAGEKAKRLREGTYFSGEGLPSLDQPSGGYAGPERRAGGDDPLGLRKK